MNFALFFQCVRGRGIHILPYLDKIKVILGKSLRMKSKEGQASASIILRNLLRSLTAILSEDYRSCPEGYDRPISECLPIRLWGKPGNIHDLQVRHHRSYKLYYSPAAAFHIQITLGTSKLDGV